jgi:hypothetical protein
MCVVSFIGNHFEEKWQEPYRPWTSSPASSYTFTTGVSQEEFDKLKKEVLEMKELLKKAKIYDEKNNEPNCEIEEKMEFLRQVAKLVGVDLDDVFKPKA